MGSFWREIEVRLSRQKERERAVMDGGGRLLYLVLVSLSSFSFFVVHRSGKGFAPLKKRKKKAF